MNIAAWHPDPTQRHEQRWWDGTMWTEHVLDGRSAGVDPMPPPTPTSLPTSAPTSAPTSVPMPVPTATAPATAGVSAAPRRHVTAWIGAGALVVIALVLALVVVLRRDDGGSSSSPEAAPLPVVPRTTVVSTTPALTSVVTTIAVAPTTDAVTTTVTAAPLTLPSTVAPATVPPTVAPETTPVPTAAPATVPPATTAPLVLATPELLAAALPGAADTPAGWSFEGGSPDTDTMSDTGWGIGMCGGDNVAARSEYVHGIGAAFSPHFGPATGGGMTVDLWAFASDADAASFVALTAAQAQACPDGVTYQLPEWDWGIFDDPATNEAIWTIDERIYFAQADAGQANEAIDIAMFWVSTTNYEGYDYGETSIDVVRYERYGRIVVVFDLWGQCCLSGFADIDPSTDFSPTTADLAADIDQLRPALLARLQTMHLI